MEPGSDGARGRLKRHAVAALGRGERAAAAAGFVRALALAPDDPGAWHGLAAATASPSALARAASLEPHVPARHRAHAALLERAGGDPARPALRALALAPGDPEAGCLLGRVRLSAGDAGAASALLERAAADAPALADAWRALAVARRRLGRLAGALRAGRRLLALSPGAAVAWLNLGNALVEAGAAGSAERAFGRALARDPGLADAAWMQALARLALGRARAGWALHERRLERPFYARFVAWRRAPEWDGRPLDGALLVWAEQGLGDTIQFARFLPLAARRCAGLVLACQPELVPLLRRSAVADRVLSLDDAPPEAAAQAPLLSLPHRLGLADAARVPPPALSVAQTPRPPGPLRVGLVWRGNAGNPLDRARSLPEAALGPLAAVPGIRLVALQKGVAPTLPGVENGGPADIDGLAAALAGLDLLVSADTMPAHLAGSLGVPVWILLPRGADWRWGPAGEATPWYPSARLFRQTAPGDWAGPVGAVAAALAAYAKN